MEFDQILPNVFVGSCPRNRGDAKHLKTEAGVSAVLNLQTDQDFGSWGIDWDAMDEAYQAVGIEVRRVPVMDFNPEQLRQKLPACVRALDTLLKAGHTVYVHCSGGINRSPSTVVAYLHWIGRMELREAVHFVMERHPCDPYVEAIQSAKWSSTD